MLKKDMGSYLDKILTIIKIMVRILYMDFVKIDSKKECDIFVFSVPFVFCIYIDLSFYILFNPKTISMVYSINSKLAILLLGRTV